MPNPIITVIMPCYNAETTLRCAVESVATQSFADLELLIIDDGSKDGSVKLAKMLALDDRRIRVITQRNAGPAEARNRGLAEATGQFIAFLDADDRWVPHLLARHIQQFSEQPNCGVSYGQIQFFDEAMRTGGRVSTIIPRLALADVLGEYPVCTTSNLICRRAVFDAAGGFDPGLTHGEDQEWVARILATTAWQVCGVNEILVHYRTSPNGLSADLGMMHKGWAEMLERVRGYAPAAVANAAPQAEALFHRYLARRALRTGQSQLSLATIIHAWRASPLAMLTRAPSRSLLTTLGVLAALLPGNPARHLLTR